MKERTHVPEIHVLRAIAIIAVVIIHTTGQPSLSLDPDSAYKWLYMFFHHFSSFAVPVFIFISGFVLIYTYRDKPFNKETIVTFYQKRLRSIILPYLLFSLFYFTLHSLKDQIEWDAWAILRTFAYQFATGTAHTHLYFMIVIVQFYLLFPVFLWLLRNKRFRKHALWTSAAVQWLYYYSYTEILMGMDGFPQFFHHTASFFPSYITFFVLGGILADHLDAVRSWFSRASFGVAALAIWLILGLWYVHIYYNGVAWNKWADAQIYEWIWFGFCFMSSLVLLGMARWIYAAFPPRIVSVFNHLGVCSFGIYLLHPAILAVWRLIPVSEHSAFFHVYYAAMFIAALGGSWFITRFFQKHFPWSWVLFGTARSRPSRKEPVRIEL